MQARTLRVLEFDKIKELLKTHATTELGSEMIDALSPSSDPREVEGWQAETEEASVIMAHSGSNPMMYFPDVREYLKRVAVGATVGQKALLDIADMYRAARGIKSALVTDRDNTPRLIEKATAIFTNRPLEEDIHSAILSEDEISDHASPELYSIRRHIRQCNERVREKLNSFIRNPDTQKYLQDSIVTMRNGRYVLQVKSESRQHMPGLIHDQSATGATLFIEPMSVVEAGNDLKQWVSKEAQEIERILAALSARVTPDVPLIKNNIDLLSELDMIFAKAVLAREMRAVQPKLNTEKRIKIIKGRHPLIDPDVVVPADLWIGEGFSCLVVTGPNTGGKTVTLKTVGLLTLMAQAGLQIPAAIGTTLAIFDEVFADIGDEQSIEQSLSTFSSHMKNIVSTLNRVTPNSLTLFDELGAGTDPTEGAALAISILERLRVMGVITLATTHYSELKAYALSTPGVDNASVEFDVETLRPTYRLSIGVPGKSNAFEISRKLGLDEGIIRDAGERLSKEQIRFEDVIANAEYHRQVAERERELAEQAHRETQLLRDEAERLSKKLEEAREGMMRKAREEARGVIKKAQQESEQIIAELKRARSKGGSNLREHEIHNLRGQLQGALDDMGERLAVPAEGAGEIPKDLKPGDTVELIQLGTRGTIITPPDSKGEAMVQAGIIKTKVHVSQLRRAAPDAPKKTSSKVSVANKPANMEVDVRGMSLDEAIQTVDLFIDACVMQALKTVYIIHGKGTGVLRSGIQTHLKKHPSVTEFRLGRYGEGEDGVTVATLK